MPHQSTVVRRRRTKRPYHVSGDGLFVTLLSVLPPKVILIPRRSFKLQLPSDSTSSRNSSFLPASRNKKPMSQLPLVAGYGLQKTASTTKSRRPTPALLASTEPSFSWDRFPLSGPKTGGLTSAAAITCTQGPGVGVGGMGVEVEVAVGTRVGVSVGVEVGPRGMAVIKRKVRILLEIGCLSLKSRWGYRHQRSSWVR